MIKKYITVVIEFQSVIQILYMQFRKKNVGKKEWE